MEYINMQVAGSHLLAQAAELLRQAFFPAYGQIAQEEVQRCLEPDRVCIGAVEKDKLLGFVGAIPQYGLTGWELHPLVVEVSCRGKGIGRGLCTALEAQLREKRCLTVYLGSDDQTNSTTLSNTDLFVNIFEKISTVENLKNHPCSFYQRIGYRIVGVIPDANGLGKPDIWMAKSLVR